MPLIQKYDIDSPHVQKTDKEITADFQYSFTQVDNSGATPKLIPTTQTYTFKTQTTVPKLGCVSSLFSPLRWPQELWLSQLILPPMDRSG